MAEVLDVSQALSSLCFPEAIFFKDELQGTCERELVQTVLFHVLILMRFVAQKYPLY